MTHDNSPATTEFVPVRPQPGTVVVTALAGVTVLDAPEGQAVYRYDIPAEGILAGWATPALIDQIRQLQRTPEDLVLVDADPDVSHELRRALAWHGLQIGETTQEQEPPEPPGPLEGEETSRIRSVLVTLFVSGAIVLGGALYSLLAPSAAEDSAAEPGTASSVAEIEPDLSGSSEASVPAPGIDSPVEEPTGDPEPPAPEQERHAVGPVSIATAPDSHVQVEGNWTTFTGADETARYHVVVTPLAELGGAQWWEMMDVNIADNPNLTHTGVAGDVLTYVEEPGDGSQSRWFMQSVGEHHVSLVCQTRSAPTREQAGACDDFVASMGE